MSQDNLVGLTVAGYKLLDHVGEGGTATVYRAEHPERGSAAIKILRHRMAQDPIAVKRFLREAEFGSRVQHPHIIQTYDYGEAEGLYYLALEWAAGEPLANFLTTAGRLAPELTAKIISQLGDALEASHKAGIIHRDLKPANIMYDPVTQTARLLDFGIARDAQDSPEERLTRAGFFVGTLQYVAPEALSGELVGEQADVYSLTTIAYHLLTGVLPFPGRGPRELFQQLLTQAPIPLNQAVRGLTFPAPIEQAMMRGLERDLGKRWKTVGEFANALHAATTQESDLPRKAGFFSSIFRKGGT
ncbi:MAG TPA: serine/threonine-protein kinase [Gemmatimonadales bacterium]|nr:serine/threonine-protein kinase [Gemmatimonadales bacterium]